MQNQQAQAATAEVGEGRELAKGNAGQQNRVRTQCRVALSRALDRVRQAAKENGKRLTARWQHVYSIERLREAYNSLNHDAAPGVDGQTWATYGEQLEANLRGLSDRLKRGAYQASPVERVYIPKADGRQRPIGKPTLEDNIVQRATVEVLNAIYEKEFLGFSYGARPGRNPHQALDAVTVGIAKRNIHWVLDADIGGFYDASDHGWLVQFVEHRIGDQRIVGHIRKWLKAGVLEEGQWRPQEEGTPQGGSASPPTKLQTFFFEIVITRIWVDPKHDIDLVVRHFHPLDQRSDEVALARPVGGLQPIVELGGKVLQPANNQLQCPIQGRLICQRLALLLQPGEALAQAGNPRLKLGLVNEALRITVDQAGHALPQLADLAFDRGQRRAFGARLGLQATPVFFREPLWVRQQGTDFLPHGQVQQVRPYLGILADTLAPKAVGVCPQTAGIGIGARFAFAGTGAQVFAIEGIATVLALEQALQQIQGASARLPRMALVLLQLFLHRRKHLRLHECRDRDHDPLLWRHITNRHSTARLYGPAALRSQPGAPRLQAGLAKRRGALIGGVLQNAPHHPAIPDRLARAGHFACPGQAATDLPNRLAVVADPGKDLPDHTGLVREDRIACLAPAFVLGHIAVPIRRAAQHIDRPDVRGMPFATPMAFDNLGAFILRNHALHLQEQIIFRAVPQGTVQKDYLHSGPTELVDQQDLVGIFPCQAIRRVARQPVHTPSGNDIAQALQRGADQRRPAVPFIKKLHRFRHGQAIDGDALAHRRHLAGNGMRLGLLLGRDTGIECHLRWMHGCGLPPTCCGSGALSVCWAARACGTGCRVMGTTRSYACTTQATRTRLGSNVRRTARGLLAWCGRRATLLSLLPWRWAPQSWSHLERCPEKPVPIAGAQLCSWDTRRKLYQHVGNFVGSVVSPILANVSLPSALDLWFEKVVKRHCHGEACLIRYADDYGCAFEQREDAERFYTVLGQRLRKFGLERSGDKTRLLPFSRCPAAAPTRFEFLGCEFHWGKDRAGKEHLKRRPSRQKLRNSPQRFTTWWKEHRHLRLRVLLERLHSKLRGYYNYYGVHGNTASLQQFFHRAIRILIQWLNRRSQRRGYNWHGYTDVLKHCKVERPRIVGRPRPKKAVLMA